MRKKESVKIESLLQFPEHISTIIGWIQREWPKGTEDSERVKARLCGKKDPNELPFTLIALEKTKLIGFINVLFHEKQLALGRPHWVDALYVQIDFRGRGVASSLLASAEARADSLKVKALYALTEIPPLYQKNKWRIAEEITLDSGIDYIMEKRLSPL